FAFGAAAGERYAVRVSSCDGIPREYQLTSPTIALADRCLGRPDQVAPGPATALEFDLPSTLPAEDRGAIASMGVWSNTGVASTTAKFNVAWPTASFLQGQGAALLSVAGHDTAYFLDYTASSTSPTYDV